MRTRRTGLRLQRGQAGEMAAVAWFRANGWRMFRTQPPLSILGMITPPIAAALKQFIPRLAAFGYMVIGRLGKGGIADFTGYSPTGFYAACEVKEVQGKEMPCSRLNKEQRAFMASLPIGSAFVGILWTDDGKFKMYPFEESGSYCRHLTSNKWRN